MLSTWRLGDASADGQTATIVPMATVERRSFRRPTRSSTSRRRWTDYNLFDADRPLVEAVRARGRRVGRGADRRGRRARRQRSAAGAGAAQANENKPELRTHDRYGNRIDEVEFHPSWHELMRHRRSSTNCTRSPWQRPAARRPRRPRRRLHVLIAGRGRGRLPDLDDLLGDPGAAHPARAGRRVGAALPLARLRPAQRAGAAEDAARWPGWG